MGSKAAPNPAVGLGCAARPGARRVGPWGTWCFPGAGRPARTPWPRPWALAGCRGRATGSGSRPSRSLRGASARAGTTRATPPGGCPTRGRRARPLGLRVRASGLVPGRASTHTTGRPGTDLCRRETSSRGVWHDRGGVVGVPELPVRFCAWCALPRTKPDARGPTIVGARPPSRGVWRHRGGVVDVPELPVHFCAWCALPRTKPDAQGPTIAGARPPSRRAWHHDWHQARAATSTGSRRGRHERLGSRRPLGIVPKDSPAALCVPSGP